MIANGLQIACFVGIALVVMDRTAIGMAVIIMASILNVPRVILRSIEQQIKEECGHEEPQF